MSHYNILRRKVPTSSITYSEEKYQKPRDILSNKDICNQLLVKWRQSLGARSVVCDRGMSCGRQWNKSKAIHIYKIKILFFSFTPRLKVGLILKI